MPKDTEKSKEKARLRSKKWYRNNKERAKEYARNMTPEQKKKKAEYCREYHRKHRERLAVYYRNRYQLKKGTSEYINAQLLHDFGITHDEYTAMLANQGGRCAICGSTDTRCVRYKRMPVDHCHRCGDVRGLLCSNCNRALGLLGESVDNLKAAITYLTSHSCGGKEK